MAKKTKKKQRVKPTRSKARRGPSAVQLWIAEVPREVWMRVLRIGITVLVVSGLCAGVAFGLDHLKGSVRADERYVVGPDAVRVVNDPPLPVPPAVKARLERETALAGPFNVLDGRVLEEIASRYARQAWVKRVVSVRRIFPDRIAVELEYRRPVAFVTQRDPSTDFVNDYYWVDEGGVRLPGVYTSNEVFRRARRMVVCRVATPPPPPGEKWIGKDLAAGLRLVKGLAGHVARRDILSVNVANYGGRLNPANSHLVLLTPDKTEIRWGSAPSEEGVYEISLQRKLFNLAWFYNKHDNKKRGLQSSQFEYIRIDLPEVYFHSRDGNGLMRG